ncbi:MAG TPA: SH3 domain-containing protein [Candidatus Angelobacter sp.]|nr:SH3 domain-containing protein [Candidatus Angelobacter sp.]
MQKSPTIVLVPVQRHVACLMLLLIAVIYSFAGCSGGGASGGTEYAYVAVTEAGLRDHVATVYNKTGVVHNGERLQILERMQNKRFVRVRSPRGEEGWVQERYLADQQTYDQFQRLAEQFKNAPAQATAAAVDQVKVHVLPGRKTGYLYLLNEKQKVDLLQRQTIDRNAPPAQLNDDKAKDAEKEKDADSDSSDEESKSSENAPPAIREDWWLVRDGQNRVGWVLGRALYLDIPDEIAQYSEGQRIVAAFPLDEVQDGDKKVPEYLVLFTENKDGMPYDFNQARVFTWNVRKHRYETAFRERNLAGVLPVVLGRQDFDKEGNLRTFILRNKEDGSVHELTYKFNPPMVRRVLAPGEEPPAKPQHKKPGRKIAANH